MNIAKILSTLTILIGFLFLIDSKSAVAQVNGEGGNIGVGVMLGEPTGVSAKMWNNERNALAFGAAWSFGTHDAIHLHGDYLLHSWLNDVEKGNLAFYYGVGGRLALSNEAHLGVRIPVGLNYIIDNSQIGLFVEAVPILDLTPATDFDGNGALGIRYYF